MKKRNIIITICFMTFIFYQTIIILDKTLAIDETQIIDNPITSIDYSNDNNKLYLTLYKTIEKYDDFLISLSSFEETDILSNNYDYMLKVASNYILDNKKYYSNKLNKNNQINVEEIYLITKTLFNHTDFYIEDLDSNNNIKLEYIADRFNNKIKNLKITNNSPDQIIADVIYELNEDYTYKYIFSIKQTILFIKNIEVVKNEEEI